LLKKREKIIRDNVNKKYDKYPFIMTNEINVSKH